MQKSTKWGTP